MPTLTTTVTAAEASGRTTTVTTTVAAPEPAPASSEDGNGITFRYWSCQARGQLARYMLYDSGLQFKEDVVDIVDVFGGGKWPALKEDPTFSGAFGALPTAEQHGEIVNETQACAQFVAEQTGYMPKSAMGRAKVVMIGDHIYEDVIVNIAYCIWEKREWERDCIGGWAGPTSGLPRKYANLEGILAKSTSGFAVGDAISMADFAIYFAVDLMATLLRSAGQESGKTDHVGEQAYQVLIGDKPSLLKHYAMIAARPNLVAHRSTPEWKDYSRYLTGKGAFGEGTVEGGMGATEKTHWCILADKLVKAYAAAAEAE